MSGTLQHLNTLRPLIVPSGFLAAAFVFVMAWWTLWRKRPSRRIWGVVASLINIATGVWPFIVAPREVLAGFGVFGALSVFGLVTLLGVVGIIAFLRREPEAVPARNSAFAKVRGDGTNSLVNKLAWVLIGVSYLGAWQWWQDWAVKNEVPGGQLTLFVILLAGFLVTFVHELGHTICGLMLGMKLRLFFAGPFQLYLREGKWEFKFDPRGILADTGGTGVVPTAPDQPRWHDVAVTLAGPLANIAVGSAALSIAFIADPASPVQSYGFPALFGAWNLVSFVLNLIPLRTGPQYSDGARIFQVLTHGPWADFHRAVSMVTSSLVTSLRPRNYDMDAIRRASAGIATGTQGLILRLYAYSHYLDCGDLVEAQQRLTEAESIYHTSASDIRVELHTVFVFGNAYVMRDPAAARQWWERMTAKKPTRFNVDYWRAKCSMHWIEGNSEAANEAWKNCGEAADRLPQAGAYQFDRYCCELLREALRVDRLETAAPLSIPR
jgi:hypothetical protein